MNFADTMSITSILACSAVLGTVFGLLFRGWTTIRTFIKNTASFFITTIHIEDEETAKAVMAHMLKKFKRSQFGNRVFGGRFENMKDGKFGHIPFEFFGGKKVLFWNGWIPIVYNINDQLNNNGNNNGGNGSSVIYWGNKPKDEKKASLVFFRWTWNPDEIVKTASELHNRVHWAVDSKEKCRFFIKKIPDANVARSHAFSPGNNISWFREGVYRLLSHNPEDLGVRIEGKGTATSNLYFPPHVLKMIEEVKLWRDRRSWYAERSIPWKRGWVLYGPPGTGKTAIARAIAEDLDMPLFVYSLGQLLNEELQKSWHEMQSHVPCIALFEDFDNVFHGRENVFGKPKIVDLLSSGPMNVNNNGGGDSQSVPTGRLSFDCLLNCIDGVEKSNGIFTIITTNHIEKLDPALGQPQKREDGTIELISTRPGRIDKAIELSYMNIEDKKKMAQRIFFDNPEGYQKMLEMTDDKKETPAQYQERCSQLALEILWKQNEEKLILDASKIEETKEAAEKTSEDTIVFQIPKKKKRIRKFAKKIFSKILG